MKFVHAAAVILVDDDKNLLIAQRPEDKIYAGYWEFPGGKLEEGETPEACIIREAQEEIGVEIEKLTPLTFISEAREGYHIIVYIFVCDKWQGMATSKEGQTITWVTATQLPDYNLLPANIPLIPLIQREVA